MFPKTMLSEKEAFSSENTDLYFLKTEKILRAHGRNPEVVFEFTPSLPKPYSFGVFAGLYDFLRVLKENDAKVTVYSMLEGELFFHASPVGEPTTYVVGPYLEICKLETPLLMAICQASGIASKAARIKMAAGEKLCVSFGTRRMHMANALIIDRYCLEGGFDAVSNVLTARKLGVKPLGTMPHALIIVFGDQVDAWRAYSSVMPPDDAFIALVDTYFDEKTEALLSAEKMPKIKGVRLDTPHSRRGDFEAIIREVRWELDIRGHQKLKIFVSGGLDEYIVEELAPLVDGFGVGTKVANAPVVDFSANIVAIKKGGKWVPCAKRGKLGGFKYIERVWDPFEELVIYSEEPRESKILRKVYENGEVLIDFKHPVEIGREVQRKIKRLPGELKDLRKRVSPVKYLAKEVGFEK